MPRLLLLDPRSHKVKSSDWKWMATAVPKMSQLSQVTFFAYAFRNYLLYAISSQRGKRILAAFTGHHSDAALLMLLTQCEEIYPGCSATTVRIPNWIQRLGNLACVIETHIVWKLVPNCFINYNSTYHTAIGWNSLSVLTIQVFFILAKKKICGMALILH